MIELFRPCLIDTAIHSRAAFDCGEHSLNDWLRLYSGQNRRRNTAATWVISDRQYRVVAYATLSMTGIRRTDAPIALGAGAPELIPALLVGRLAVDQSPTGLGLGTALVRHILMTAIELNTKAACRAIVVTALNARSRSWWERLGFTPFDPEAPEAMDLYLLTQDVRATLESS